MKNSIDLSALFSGLNNNNSITNGINLNDYSAIKNGSYGKLMKAYYAKDASDVSEKSQAINKLAGKTVQTDSTGLSEMKKTADSLKESVSKLTDKDMWKQTDGAFDTEKITEAVESFAKSYNAAVKQSDKVTSTDISKTVDYMKDLTKVFSNTLSKAGISVGTDGLMKVDTKALGKADMNTVKSLFDGKATYGSEIEAKAADIAKTAVSNTSLYNSEAALNSSMTNLFNSFV